MIDYIGCVYARLFGRGCFSSINKALFYLSSRGLGIMNYSSDEISGELFVLKRILKNKKNPIVFDVGANNGAWASRVLEENPGTVLHVFEPQPDLIKTFMISHDKARINQVAVGCSSGSLVLYDYSEGVGSQHASLVKGVIENIHHEKSREFNVEVVSLDGYCLLNNVNNIDLLKIDVEGFEMEVLKGAKRLLEGGCVQAIQFEFNGMNVIQRVFFKDFYDLLESDFCIYRILPSGLLQLKSYSAWLLEQFAFQNILAIKKT